ncbi:MAG: hypothetical protein ABSC37_03395 [Xanthobacteraceae bacterium]
METPSLSSLEGLTDLGLRDRVDMRPTLLRVLTDLYVQKLTHTPDEERHYTELALRLLESVDVPTRAAVAARLAHHLSPPERVIQRLAGDLPEVAAPLRSHSLLQPSGTVAEAAQRPPLGPTAEAAPDQADHERNGESNALTGVPDTIGSDVAGELNELFFAADANERRLILLNLDIVASLPAGRAGVSRDPSVGRQLEAAALARKREDFARQLARSLLISREQAQRIARDQLGEPIVVAAKALSIPRDVLYRILLFVNTAVGHSVERVHALAELYDAMSAQAAEHLVAIWQALNLGKGERAAGRHQPLLANDESRARPATAVQRTPAVSRSNERRDAS